MGKRKKKAVEKENSLSWKAFLVQTASGAIAGIIAGVIVNMITR